MKRKLLALVFVLAFAISSFAALGVSGVSATIDFTTPGGHVVEGPCAAVTGFQIGLNTDTPLEPAHPDCP